MLCDECSKNKATVHLTEIVNEQITKLNLCEVCAKQKGADAEQHFGIADLLAALSDVEEPGSPGASPASSGSSAPKHKCPNCGLSYEDFKKIGRLGCSDCYLAFRASLTPLLKRIHGSNQHSGKSPSALAAKEFKSGHQIEQELEAARLDLQKAVKKEEFEEAAALRDKVKFLERKIKEHSKQEKKSG